MNKQTADRLVQAIGDGVRNAVNKFVDEVPTGNGSGPKLTGPGADYSKVQPGEWQKSNTRPVVEMPTADPDKEKLYQWLKKRLLDDLRVDPVFVKLLASGTPEMFVEIEPKVVELKAAGSLKGRVARLIASGFFNETRATFAVRSELKRTGTDPGGGGNLSTALGDFVVDGFLVRDGDGFVKAAGVKVTEKAIETR